MYLKRVRLTNIRSFHDGRRVDLDLTRPDGSYAGWTVLAGRNGSGKTTLLRAIALALSGPDVARGLVPDFESWISAGTSRASADIVIEDTPDLDRYPQGVLWHPEPPFSAGLVWTVPAGRSAADKPGGVRFDGTGDEFLSDGPWSAQPSTGWFCAGYGPFRRLAGGSGTVQRLMRSAGPISRLTSLFHEDASLAEGVSWLIAQHLRAFEERPGAQELKDAALAILGDDLLPDDYRIAGVDSEGLWVEHAGDRFPLREMSDGYRTVAALVVDLLKHLESAFGELAVDHSSGHPVIPLPGVVLIDEIDAHLHVSWQKRIGGWLTAHFPAIQFLVTTHSPYICQAADPGGLIRLPGLDEDRPVEVVSEDLYRRIIYGSGDDAALSDLFGLDSPYSERADAVRDELADLEMGVLRGTADDADRVRYRVLKEKLTSSPAARAEEIAVQLRQDPRAADS